MNCEISCQELSYFGKLCLEILFVAGFLLLQCVGHMINIYVHFSEFHYAKVIITVVILCCIKLQMYKSPLKEHISIICVYPALDGRNSL